MPAPSAERRSLPPGQRDQDGLHHACRHQLTFAWHGQSEGFCDEGVVVLVAEYQDAFSTERSPGAAVASCPLHEVVLLGDRCKLCPAHDASVDLTKQLVDSRLTVPITTARPRIEDGSPRLGVDLMEEVRR